MAKVSDRLVVSDVEAAVQVVVHSPRRSSTGCACSSTISPTRGCSASLRI
jgi:hypothetical protein